MSFSFGDDVIVVVQLRVIWPGVCKWYRRSDEKRWMVRRARASVVTHPPHCVLACGVMMFLIVSLWSELEVDGLVNKSPMF